MPRFLISEAISLLTPSVSFTPEARSPNLPTNSLAGTNDFFQWFDDNLSSFGAYGNPYQDGLFAEDLLLVIG